MKKNNSEVITAEVIEEVPLEKQIDNTLIRHNVTDAVISQLKDEYGNLRLKSIDDKENYLLIVEAKKNVRKIGILVEKVCEHGRNDAIKVQRLWLTKQKEVLAKIAEVQDPLQSEIDKFEAEEERKVQAEIKRKEEAFINRQSTLAKLGATYQGGSFILNDVSYELNLIKESDEDVWVNAILPKYTIQYEKNESVRVAEKLKLEKAAFEKEKKELEEARAALQKQKDEADKVLRDDQEKKNVEAREKARQKIHDRCDQLYKLGMAFNPQYDCYKFEDVNVDSKTEICLLPDKEWDELIVKIIPVIEQRKKEAEDKRLLQVEEEVRAAALNAIKTERERAEREKADLEKKRLEDEQRKAEEMAKASDSMKWKHFIEVLIPQSYPEMKSPTYKGKIAEARKLIEKIINL